MRYSSLSIIIPAYNEAENLPILLERIEQIFTLADRKYEVIIIDDRSTDNTRAVIGRLTHRLPIRLFIKQGKPGKAYSLLEGFAHARYSLMAMIDADLQYPPENILPMVEQLETGYDIVVGNRSMREDNNLRTLLSHGFHYVFCNVLHGLAVDSQSGLKVFKRSILKRIRTNPAPWTFDLEFLLEARNAGYRIGSFDIEFKRRLSGQSKINVIKASGQIGWNALKLKFKQPQVIPFASGHPVAGNGFHFKGKEYVHYNGLPMEETALLNLTGAETKLFLVLAGVLGIAFLINWHLALTALLAIMIAIYFSDVIFNLILVYQPLAHNRLYAYSSSKLRRLKTSQLPLYTIFCPLYKEWQVLPQFVQAIEALDYPKTKLQVLLLLEQNDIETIKHAKSMPLPPYVQVIVVPHTLPKTKPKACNYGLRFAKGKYAVIYDAEDMPDPLQLKKAVLAFSAAPPQVKCVQAKLNFYNPEQNLLTRFFTLEYSLWFDLILPGLQSLKVPIPLGGTSNHFRVKDLESIKGWDAFNVTEDADLGVRLATKGYETIIIDSVTLEEANSRLMNWFNQRSRWLKGYLQTYLVHMRKVGSLVKERKGRVISGIQLVVGGKVFALLVNPFMWMMSILYFAFRPTVGSFIESLFPPVVFYLGVISFVIGNFLYLYYFMIAATVNHRFSLVKYAFFMPLYWLYISIAAWNAIIGLIIKPHYWFKTTHGFHLQPSQKATPVPIVEDSLSEPSVAHVVN